MKNSDKERYFSFLGVTVAIESYCIEFLSRICTDFAAFKCGRPVHIHISLKHINSIDVPESGHKVSFFNGIEALDQGSYRHIDYGQAQLAIDFNQEKLTVAGQDLHLLHEISYLAILSRVGKILDQKGMHRLHAFSVVFDGKCFCGIGPSGIGKSTLMLELLNRGAHLVSDDIPMLTNDGLRPFPIRIGLTEDTIGDAQADYSLRRRRFGVKRLLAAKRFKIETEKQFEPIFLILKRGASRPKVYTSGRFQFFRALFSYCVLGLGTPMILELFWESTWKDFVIKGRIALNRLLVSNYHTWRSPCYVLEMSSDISSNADSLSNFFKSDFR